MPESNHPRWSLEDLPFDTPERLASAQAELERLVQVLEKSRDGLTAGLPVPEFLDLLHAQENIFALGSRMGACAYLEKPVDIDTLTRTMNDAYRRVRQRKA